MTTTLNQAGITSEVADELISTLENSLSRYNLELTSDTFDLVLDLKEILFTTTCREIN